MNQRNIFTITLIILLFAVGGASAYLLKSKAATESALLAAQHTSESQIEALEKQIEALKEVKSIPSIPLASLEQQAPVEPQEGDLKEEIIEPPSTMPITQNPIAETEKKPKIPKTGPILTTTPEVFDLGTISKKNGIATANFELKNTGTSDLEISYAFTSCGCTVSPLKEEKILKPGEVYKMDVTYDPNFYGTQYELGNIEKTITIISNDSGKPFYKIKLKANVTS